MDKGYTQAGPYMPPGDAAFRSWLLNFSSLISADPQRYGLLPSDAAVIQGHFDAYDPLWAQCQQPSVRTTSLIQQKDAVKASAMASCRVYAMLIKVNQGVDELDKSALGLHLNDSTPSPIPVPATAPLLMIQAAFSGEHVIRYADESSPASRKKPFGAIQIQINRNVAPGANPDVNQSTMVGLYTKQPIHVAQDQANTGLTATYMARWVTRKGEFGPWGLPVAMTIAFGGPVDQQAFVPQGGTPMAGDGEQLKIAA